MVMSRSVSAVVLSVALVALPSPSGGQGGAMTTVRAISVPGPTSMVLRWPVAGRVEVRLWGVYPRYTYRYMVRNALRQIVSGRTMFCQKVDWWNGKRAVRCFVGGRDVAMELRCRGFVFDYVRESRGAYSECKP